MQEFMYEQEHRLFRDAFREFAAKEITPNEDAWAAAGQVDRDLWTKAGANGFLCMDVDEEYGGGGAPDFRFNVIVSEELARAHASGPGFSVHTDIAVPYISAYGTADQKARWLPRLVTGETIAAIAMTEPGTGSDLQGIQTTAIRDGDDWIIDGQKTFITNGIHADLVIVVCRTNPDAGYQGISLLIVERGTAGFERGRNLAKMGMKGNDTGELFFNGVRVPADHLLGEEGMGFVYLMQQLPQERLIIGVQAQAAAEAALDLTKAYCRERVAFGRPIGSFQNSRFKLAEMQTEVTIGRVFTDHCIEALADGALSTETASMAKWWLTEMQGRVVDQCLQLHGGYGYMAEYPISKFYTDSRASRIYGGTNEIMKEIIGRGMGF